MELVFRSPPGYIRDAGPTRTYAHPSPGETDRLLEANGVTGDEYLPERERDLLDRDRVWPEIQIPDSGIDGRQE